MQFSCSVAKPHYTHQFNLKSIPAPPLTLNRNLHLPAPPPPPKKKPDPVSQARLANYLFPILYCDFTRKNPVLPSIGTVNVPFTGVAATGTQASVSVVFFSSDNVPVPLAVICRLFPERVTALI